ncbi:MAG: hypothetical protein ABIJ59_12395 [Pseudomonadota bacterium]
MDKYIYCPNCEDCNIEQTDYEDETGKEDTDGRRCLQCGWEGDISELVCKNQMVIEGEAQDVEKTQSLRKNI